MKQFNLRIGNLEARVTNRHLITAKEGEPITIDIVQWEADSCYSIAYFEVSRENIWNLVWVQDRPLDERVDWNDFKTVVIEGYKYLSKLEEFKPL